MLPLVIERVFVQKFLELNLFSPPVLLALLGMVVVMVGLEMGRAVIRHGAVRALMGLLASVNQHVLTESRCARTFHIALFAWERVLFLVNGHDVTMEVRQLCKSRITHCTLVGAFAGMCAFVNCQEWICNESRVALLALEWFLTGVNSFVNFQVI